MAGKHTGAARRSSVLGQNYIPGGRLDRAYAEGRAAAITGEINGTDDTSTAAATMTDSTASFATAGSGLDGRLITNVTISQNAIITANSGTVITGILSGSGNWDSGDVYHISGAVRATANPHVTGTDESTAWLAGFNGAAFTAFQYETDRST